MLIRVAKGMIKEFKLQQLGFGDDKGVEVDWKRWFIEYWDSNRVFLISLTIKNGS